MIFENIRRFEEFVIIELMDDGCLELISYK